VSLDIVNGREAALLAKVLYGALCKVAVSLSIKFKTRLIVGIEPTQFHFTDKIFNL
jgi:hypothetical protein